MAAPTPNAVIQLGLITIPIKIYPAARNASTELSNLHRTCAEKGTEASLGMLKRCKGCLVEVPNEQIVKGWKKSDGTFLLFTPEEIASLQAEKSKGMEVRGFVDFDQVDPLWLGPSNFIGPVDKTSLRLFLLLFETMKAENLAAVVSYYGHGRDKRGILRAGDETIILYDCFFPSELRTYAEQAKVELTKSDFTAQERQLATRLIDDLKCDFDPLWQTDMAADSFLERVETLKTAREQGLPMPAGLPPTPSVETGADLMSLLTGSIASIKGKRQITADAPSKPPAKVPATAKAVGKKKSA